MRAVRLVEFGRPLRLQELPVPEPGPGEVLVRVRAAGICRSDVHYRAGLSRALKPPVTLGHEIAGVIEAAGPGVTGPAPGDRVCLHYLRSCGDCGHCRTSQETFCAKAAMLGHHANGGFAEFVAVPACNAVPLPDAVPFEHGAVLMCSSATAFHALRQGRLAAGETVAVFGAGGLGQSAVQLARAFGALDVFAVDLDEAKLALAARHGAVPVPAGGEDPAAGIRRRTGGRGVDVALELIGLPETMLQAVRCLAPRGRAVIAGLSRAPLVLDVYADLLAGENELIGTNDHRLAELPPLVELARRGILDLSGVVTASVPLEAAAIDRALDDLERHAGGVRTVVVP